MASITSAGVASGIDFESIIAASVKAKQTQLNRSLIIRKEENNIEISGVGKLKSALETFQKSMKSFTEGSAFNERKITTNQPEKDPFFTVKGNKDATNMYHDIAVKQLASSEKLKTTIADADKKYGAGKITIDTGIKGADGKNKVLEIDVDKDDTIDSIRRKINDNNIGVTANMVKTKNGVQLTIDSGVTGNGKSNMTITTSGDRSLDVFKSDKMTKEAGKDAIIIVDGQEIANDSNVFDTQVSGITITATKVSEKDDKGNFKTNSVELTEDAEAVTKKMQEFIDAYNALHKTMDELYKRNTYEDGKNNYDGGELAGDSMVKSMQYAMSNMITTYGSDAAAAGKDALSIFNMGIKFEKDGTLSLDSTKFKESLKDNYNQVVNAFSGEKSLINKFETLVKDYTKSGGILAEREDRLQTENKDIGKKEASNAELLAKYEEGLRQKYASLDNLIAGYNSSMSYISQIMAQSSPK